MIDRFGAHRHATTSALLDRSGALPADLREAIADGVAPPELADLVRKIDSGAHTVSDEDIDGLRQAYTEDQLFDIIVCAAFGSARRRLAAARRALEEA